MTAPRIAMAVAGAAALVALTGCGAISAASERRLEFTGAEHATFTTVIIKGGSGDVTVHSGTATGTTIKRVVRYHGDEPTSATYRVDGSSLVLDTDCGRRCSVSYDVAMPPGVAVQGELGAGNLALTGVNSVDVEVSSGDVVINDVAGAVRASVSSGNLSVTGGRGETTLTASSGEVTGRHLGGPVKAEADSGNVDLQLDQANSVRARVSSGSVRLAVPPGHYRVRTNGDSGSREVSVPDDPNASALIDVQADSGDITVRQT
ncbi:DUF4097 family beta strand repeat-containing protein [Plantactinospora siamensis]|uniref:DUF4097 family beta strand repeat-containing protein n=1 Tax=Plantactinospora siamensis TaxID=555372 RepID=A0ABV6NUL2_9ACTN